MPRILPKLVIAAAIAGTGQLLLPAVGLAATTTEPTGPLALPGVQVWALVAGSIIPLAGYVLNHYAPWCSEPVKALVQVVLAAAVGAVTQLLDAGTFAVDLSTLEVIGTAVAGALLAHKTLWLPAGISAALGGGSNAQGAPPAG